MRPVLTSWKRNMLVALVYVRRRNEPGRCSLASTCDAHRVAALWCILVALQPACI